MSCEITTILKDEEKRLSTKYIVYDNETHDGESVRASIDDVTIRDCVKKSLANFASESGDVSVKVKIEIEVR